MVQTVDGESREQLFCGECDLPIELSKYHYRDSQLICSTCHGVFNLDLINVNNPGFLVWAPELSQQEVTAFSISLCFISEFDDTEEVYEEIASFFSEKRDVMERMVGEGTSDPAILCQFLYGLSDEDYEGRAHLMKSIRLFPSDDFLFETINYLKLNELDKYRPERWVGLLQHVNEELNKKNN